MTGAADTQAAGEDEAAAVKTTAIRGWGWGMGYELTRGRWGWSALGWTRNGRICSRERQGKGCLWRGKDRWHPLEEEGAALNLRA